MNFTRRSRFRMDDDSFVISDSDDEDNTSKSSRGDKSNNSKDPKDGEVIAESDPDSSNKPDLDDSENNAEISEDESFMNRSHRVSILENSSDSESDSAKNNNFAVKKLKRRSIYDSPSHNYTPKAGNTPISCLRKKSRNDISDPESSSDDFMKNSKRTVQRKAINVISDDEDDDDDEDKMVPMHNTSVEKLNQGQEKSVSSIESDSSKEFISINKKHENLAEDQNASEVITVSSSTSASENEIDQHAVQFAKKQTDVNDKKKEDAQKNKLLDQIELTKDQIDKFENFTVTMDLNKLPDKGKKVIEILSQHKRKLIQLKTEVAELSLKSVGKNKSMTPNKKLEFKNSTPLPKNTSKIDSYHISSSDENKENVKTNKNFLTPRTKIRQISISSSDESREGVQYKNLIQRKQSISDPSSSDESQRKTSINKIVNHPIKTNNQHQQYSNHFDFNVRDIPNVPLTSFQLDDLGKKALETLNKQQTLTHKRLEQLHGSLTTRPTEDKRAKDPYGLNIELMDHQRHALAWMLWREKQKPKGGILADDMGLGKTLSMISLVLSKVNEKRDSEDSDESSDDEWYSRKKHKRYYGGTLVVCPASLIKQWEAEVKNRCKRGILTVLVFHGNNRSIDDRRLSKYSIVVTTYQTVVREAQAETGMYKMEWDRVILDEAHYIRNHKSKACEAVCGLNSKFRWALTGTPIQNKETDLYAILKFLKCSPFDDLSVWKRWVDNKNEAGKQRLVTIMKTIMLRRTKQELQSKGAVESLPEKNLEVIEISLDRDEKLVYQKILLFSQNLFAQFLAQRAEKQHMREMYGERPSFHNTGKNTQFTKAQKLLLDHHSKQIETHEILVLLLRLRQMCCHPALIHAMLDRQDVEDNGLEDQDTNVDLLNKLQNMSINENEEVDEVAANFQVDQRVAANLLTKKNPVFDDDRCSSKVKAVMKTVEKILEKDDKLIVVSQWSNFLKVIAKNLDDYDDAKYAMFTGEVAVKDRQNVVDKLNNPRSKVRILLLSLTAGGVGLNLVGANHLLLIDIHWNPQLELQAQDRIYRFGQKKNVYVYKFICKDTIEERVRDLQDRKLSLAQDVLTGSKTVSSKLTIEDLKSLFS